MRALVALMGVLFLASAAGCSSDSSKSADGGGGAAGTGAGGSGGSGGGGTAGTGGGGTAGTGGGGTAGTGGGTAGTGGGGTAGTGGGAAGTVGRAGTTGGAGTGGAAGGGGMMNTGAGGNPAGCPASAPSLPLQSCTFDMTAACNYPGATCVCRTAGATNVWTCLACPDVEPANGSACGPPTGLTTAIVTCPYGNDGCACRTDGWYCRCKGCP